MNNREAFESACELLPDGVTWGEPITPSIAKHIAALASQTPQPALVEISEYGEGQENDCPECGAEIGESCSSSDGVEYGRKVHESRQSQAQQEPSKDIHEAITLLSAVFDAWENGTDCYDDFDGVSGSFIGKAFNLDDEIFKRCCDLLNRVNPPRNVSQAQQESKPVIAYEVRAYGRMQKIIVRDDVAEEYADKLKADGCENVEVRDLVYALPPSPEGDKP